MLPITSLLFGDVKLNIALLVTYYSILWLAQDYEPDAKKLKTGSMWLSNVRTKNGIITDDILREKAKEPKSQENNSIAMT